MRNDEIVQTSFDLQMIDMKPFNINNIINNNRNWGANSNHELNLFSLSFFFPWMISPSSANGNQLILYKFYWYFFAKICCQALDSKLNGSCITFRSKSLAAVAMSKFAFAALRTYLKSLEICCINQWIKRQPYFIRLIIMREKEIFFLLFCWNFIFGVVCVYLVKIGRNFSNAFSISWARYSAWY